MDRHFEVTETAATRIEETVPILVPEDLSEESFDRTLQEDKQAISIIDSLADGVREASRTLSDAAQSLRSVVAKQREALASSAWQAAVDDAESQLPEFGRRTTRGRRHRSERIRSPDQ